MSQTVDKTGLRTLAVVTKADRAPEGLLEKVSNDDVNIGLGYVCVRNRIGDESYGEARVEERKLFDNHPLLSKIDNLIVGIPVLAQKLVQIQATIISKCLPNIVNQINDKLNSYVLELNSMPQSFDSVAEALTAFIRILNTTKESLKKIFIRGEYDEYPDDKEMHCSARLVEMLNRYSYELQSKGEGENEPEFNFLVEEIQILEEAKGIGLPNFLPRTALITILQSKVKRISHTLVEFVNRVWGYVEGVVVSVLLQQTDSYPQLQYSTRRAAHNLIAKMREQSIDGVMEIVEMEKLTDYTCNPALFAVNKKIKNLMEEENKTHEAFDMKMRIIAYWKIVLRRLVDIVALHLLFSIQNLVNKDMEKEIINELMGPLGGGIERMLDDSPSMAGKHERLKNSIKLLKGSKDAVAEIMDKIVVNQE
ncbi:hypothetical protein Ancab_000332 [Ancistrocladus abbreviatus]